MKPVLATPERMTKLNVGVLIPVDVVAVRFGTVVAITFTRLGKNPVPVGAVPDRLAELRMANCETGNVNPVGVAV